MSSDPMSPWARPDLRSALLAALALSAATAASGRVVINEIFYHAPRGIENLEYVELHNAADDAVDLGGWKFSKGLKFTFPAGARIDAGGFVVLCRDEVRFHEHYPNIPVAGTFTSKLSNRGERLELSDARGRIVDTVKYQDTAPWPLAADGGSASLERICPDSGGDNFANWMASPGSRDGRQPAGTPGATNASYSEALPPIITKVRTVPPVPAEGQSFQIEANIRDGEGVAGAELRYALADRGADGPEAAEPMVESSEGVYRAVVPAQPSGRLIRYRVAATGTSGARRNFPARTEPHPALLAFVPPAAPDDRTRLAVVWLPETRPEPATTEPGTAFVHLDRRANALSVLDHVRLERHKNGWQVHFAKGDGLEFASSVALKPARNASECVAEWLAYEMFRRAGVATPRCQPVRVENSAATAAWHLLEERPGRGFALRHHLDDNGHLYEFDSKGRGPIAQHVKRTQPEEGHAGLIQLLEQLGTNDLAARWAVIQKQFDVAEVIHYFAANTLVASPGGFARHYLVYHDADGTGRWTIHPWDQDHTWGAHDETPGQPSARAPLPFGAAAGEGASSSRNDPAYFARPLLTTPQFRRLYLARTRELLETVFTESVLQLLLSELDGDLAPEIRRWAERERRSPDEAAAEWHRQLDEFRTFLHARREHLLAQDEIRGAGRFTTDGLEKPVSRKAGSSKSSAPPASPGRDGGRPNR